MSLTQESAKQRAQNFDLANLSEDFYTNPFPYYHALREHAPIKALPGGGFFLSRYQDIEYVYKHPDVFSSDKKKEFRPKYGNTLLYEHHTTSLVFNDPPLHTRVRKLLNGALVPRAIEAMRESLIVLVDHLLDQMAENPECDLIEDYASAIPVEVIGNLLGVPHEHRSPLRAWSLSILGALEPVISEAALNEGNKSVREFIDYLEVLIKERRAHPKNPDSDVLTRLIQGEENGEKLSAKELLHNCIFMLNAGHETTTNLIGNGLMLLAEYSAQRDLLLKHPEYIKPAIEEFLRFESPNQLGNRITTQATTIAGVAIPADTSITLCMAAANRDPDKFSAPDTLDITRKPNRHIAFAGGIHHCAGISLARLEGQIAISHMLKRFPSYRMCGKAVRGGRARFRGYLSLPCRPG